MRWRDYILDGQVPIYTCRKCHKTFVNNLEECKLHILKEHEIGIEIKTCQRCGDPFIPRIPEQVVCEKRECILGIKQEIKK